MLLNDVNRSCCMFTCAVNCFLFQVSMKLVHNLGTGWRGLTDWQVHGVNDITVTTQTSDSSECFSPAVVTVFLWAAHLHVLPPRWCVPVSMRWKKVVHQPWRPWQETSIWFPGSTLKVSGDVIRLSPLWAASHQEFAAVQISHQVWADINTLCLLSKINVVIHIEYIRINFKVYETGFGV